MELITKGLFESKAFKCLGPFDSVVYANVLGSKLQRFEVKSGEVIAQLYLSALIRKEESLAWKAYQDMLMHAMKMAASMIQGFYGFNILSLEIDQEANRFQPNAFAALIANHARKLDPGQTVFIQYGSLFGILKKRIPEAWGKIDLETPVEIFSKEPVHLDLWMKKMLREAAELRTLSPSDIFVIHDLSKSSVLEKEFEEQTKRISKTAVKIQKEKGFFPKFFFLHPSFAGRKWEVSAEGQIRPTTCSGESRK